jgi:glycolate oxidase FAD binding subunit
VADNEGLLLTRFAGIGKTVGYQVERTIAHLRGEAGVAQIDTESNDRNLWSRLAAAPMELDEIVSWRATVPTTRVGEFIGRVNEKYPLSISKSKWQAGIADGRIRMMERPMLKTAAEESSRLTHLRTLAESFGGSLVIESATDEMKTALDAWGPRASSDNVMKRIKHELDPQGILSPGRFFG